MSLPETFWAKTATTDCLVWTGAVNSKGYACFGVDGTSQLAHRLAYEDVHGLIPDGMTVDHTCRVRNCVRVDHLELVTASENNRRARVSSGLGVGGACGQGHALVGTNVTVSPRGRTICRTCAREHAAAAGARRAAVLGEIPASTIREWALEVGIPVSQRGRLSPDVRRLYAEAHRPLKQAV